MKNADEEKETASQVMTGIQLQGACIQITENDIRQVLWCMLDHYATKTIEHIDKRWLLLEAFHNDALERIDARRKCAVADIKDQLPLYLLIFSLGIL